MSSMLVAILGSFGSLIAQSSSPVRVFQIAARLSLAPAINSESGEKARVRHGPVRRSLPMRAIAFAGRRSPNASSLFALRIERRAYTKRRNRAASVAQVEPLPLTASSLGPALYLRQRRSHESLALVARAAAVRPIDAVLVDGERSRVALFDSDVFGRAARRRNAPNDARRPVARSEPAGTRVIDEARVNTDRADPVALADEHFQVAPFATGANDRVLTVGVVGARTSAQVDAVGVEHGPAGIVETRGNDDRRSARLR